MDDGDIGIWFKSLAMDRKCSLCNAIKCEDDFGIDKHSKDGRSKRCLECRRSESRKWRKKQDPEKLKAKSVIYELNRKEKRKAYRSQPNVREQRRSYNKSWAAKNPEKRRIKEKKWIAKNREYVNERMRKYRRKNREYFARLNKAWAEKNPEKYRAIRLASMERRRARVRAASGNLTTLEIKQLLLDQQSKCFACGADIGTCYTIDHIIPLARGGTHDVNNVQLLCGYCNSSKGSKDPTAWAIETGRRVRGISIIR